MPKRIVAMVASAVAALAGGWLILAPFALGYRPRSGSWDHATEVDVWTGVGIVVVGLMCLTAALLATVADLRAGGALPAVPSRAARRRVRRADQSQAKGAEQGQLGAPELGQAPGEAVARTAVPPDGGTVVPPDGSTAPGVAGEASPEPDLRHLLASLVQALVDDTGHADARPLNPRPESHPADTHPPDPGPVGVGDADSAARTGHDRWRKTS